MVNTISTPKHTDPATKSKEKQNEEVIKDKPSGKAVKTQKKQVFFNLKRARRVGCAGLFYG
ncbi:hypothetical protein [Hymenobacter siberiensis]|uniref:hypothetical protein n=1 Tax=Hymenobacter siberiensis TaxID=2848396 RepID=UPI001C1E3AD8|nr:hypothetical protein [Hymenobacter siberiensis]